MHLPSLLAFLTRRIRKARPHAAFLPVLALLAGLCACAPSVVLDARKAPAWRSPAPVPSCWTRSEPDRVDPVEPPDHSSLPSDVREQLDWIPRDRDAFLLRPLHWDLAFAHDPCRSDTASPYLVLRLHSGARGDSLLLDSLRIALPEARSPKWMTLAADGFAGRSRLDTRLRIVAVNRMPLDAWARELARIPHPRFRYFEDSLTRSWLRKNAWLQDTVHHVLTLELATSFPHSRTLTDTLVLDQDAWRLRRTGELP